MKKETRRVKLDFNENIKSAEKFLKSKKFDKFEKLTTIQQKFIVMQLKNTTKRKSSMRYDLEEKILSLALYKQSPRGYKLLQKLFTLPNKRTLNRVLQHIKFYSGINKPFFDCLKSKIENWSEAKKICSIVFDEVQLSPHITFVPSMDMIHGFVEEVDEPRFADHALVFMIRGICGSWRQPIAYYFCEGTIPQNKLKQILSDVVRAVVDTGLDPLTFICDQGVTFQSTLKAMQEATRVHQQNINLHYGKSCH